VCHRLFGFTVCGKYKKQVQLLKTAPEAGSKKEKESISDLVLMCRDLSREIYSSIT
jgi:hypothetical protein